MECNICYKEVNQRTQLDNKWLCNDCLGANYPKILSEHNQKVKQLKDKLHLKDEQIKEFKIKFEKYNQIIAKLTTKGA